MILAFVCACQLALAQHIDIRIAEQTERITLERSGGVQYVPIRALESHLGARLRTLPSGRISLSIGNENFEFAHGVPFTRSTDKVIPLHGSPRIGQGETAVPLSFLTDVLPRFSSQLAFHPESGSLALVDASGPRPSGAAGTGAKVLAGAPAESRATVAAVAAGVEKPARRRLVVVDAGHGGPDEGTSVVLKDGTRVVEKEIALRVARLLGEELRRRDYDVVFTRNRDTLIALQDRGRIANRNSGSAFISVHVNAAGPGPNRTTIRGVETYFLSTAKTEDAKRVQALENSSVRFEQDAAPGAIDPLSFILGDMRQNEHLRQSSDLAAAIQSTLSRSHPGGDRGVKQAEFAVLVGSFMPSVLVEIGYLSNPTDAAFVRNAENQRKIAVAIASAVDTYFKSYDKRIAASGDPR